MTKLLPLYVVCSFLAYMSDRVSVRDEIHNRYIHKDKFFYVIMTIVAILFAGLRTSYNDTGTYIETYDNLILDKGVLTGVSTSIGDYPLYTLMRNYIKYLGFSSQVYIMIFSILCVGVALWFVREHSDDLSLSVYLFFTMGYFGFCMAAIKQCSAMAICLIAVDRLLKGRRIQFFIWLCIAVLFHPFAIMFIVAPFLQFRPWTIRTLLMFGATGIIGVSMQTWLSKVVDLMALMGRDYDESQLVGYGVNLFRLAVVWAPVCLSYFTSQYWKYNNDKEQNTIINLMMLNAEIMTIAAFGNPIYFGRLANYFLLFQVIGLPMLLKCFEPRSKLLVKLSIIVLFFAYAYYGNVEGSSSFDNAFTSISLWKFITHLH